MKVPPRTRAAALLGSALLATPLAACGESGSASEDSVTFLGPVPASVFMFPGFVADELGFFEEEGIEFEYETIGESVSMTTLLLNGSVDVAGPGSTEVFQGLAAGQEFGIVYDHYKMAAEGIVTLADNDIESLEEIEGGTVGISGDDVASLLSVALDAAGLDDGAVEVVNIGTSSATILNSFESGDIDAFVGGVIDFAGLQAAGTELRYITPDELASMPATSFAVSPRFVDENEEQLVGFLRAWSKGLHVGLRDPELVERIMREVAPEEWTDEETGLATLDVAIDLQQQGPEGYGSLEQESWQAAMEQAVLAGDIEEPIDLSTILDDSFIDATNEWDRAEIETIADDWLAAN